MTKQKSSPKAKTTAIVKVASKANDPTNAVRPTQRTNPKQVKVIGMLSQPMGSTISAIMKATG